MPLILHTVTRPLCSNYDRALNILSGALISTDQPHNCNTDEAPQNSSSHNLTRKVEDWRDVIAQSLAATNRVTEQLNWLTVESLFMSCSISWMASLIDNLHLLNLIVLVIN